MNSWLCMTREENWNVIRSKRIWGVAEKDKKRLERVNVGDFLVFYVKQKRKKDEIVGAKITSIFKAVSAPFFSQERIFASYLIELFPWRIKIQPEVTPKEPVEFQKLIPKLRFIKNKKNWGAHLQVVMRAIPEEDFNLIRSEIMHKRAPTAQRVPK